MSKTHLHPTIIAVICLALFCSFINPIGFIDKDEIEHLRASFLISQGQIPFLDFFQHHHLLLNYLFAPIFEFIYRNPIIFFIARFFIYGILLTCTWYGVKILDCLPINKAYNRIIFPLIFLFLSIQNVTIFQFRPDTLMILFFLMGLFYFFHFLNDKKIRFLSLSFLCFVLSFFSLQKIIILYPVIFLACMWLLYKKELMLKQFFLATVPAVLTTLFYILYLLLTDSFKPYFTCSFTVNKLLTQTLTHPFHFLSGNIFIPIYVCLLLLPYLIWKYKNLQIVMLAGFFIISFIQSCFLNPWSQYYIPLITLSAITLSLALSSCLQTGSKKSLFYSYLGSFLALFIIGFHYQMIKPSLDDYTGNYAKLLSIISEKDTVADEFRDFNIWNPTTTWHEFFLVQEIDYEKLGLPKKDADENIRKNKPTVIHAGGGPLLHDLLPEYDRISTDVIGFPWAIYKKKN